MFKIGDKVVITKSERGYYQAPYDGVVTRTHSNDSYSVRFSDGGCGVIFEKFLEADDSMAKFKVGDSVQIKMSRQEGFRRPYEGVVINCLPGNPDMWKYEVKFSDGLSVFMNGDDLKLLPSQDYEKMVEILRGIGYFVEKL